METLKPIPLSEQRKRQKAAKKALKDSKMLKDNQKLLERRERSIKDKESKQRLNDQIQTATETPEQGQQRLELKLKTTKEEMTSFLTKFKNIRTNIGYDNLVKQLKPEVLDPITKKINEIENANDEEIVRFDEAFNAGQTQLEENSKNPSTELNFVFEFEIYTKIYEILLEWQEKVMVSYAELTELIMAINKGDINV